MPYWWINKVTVVQNSGSETLRTEKLFCKTNILTNLYLERKYILKLLYCAFFLMLAIGDYMIKILEFSSEIWETLLD
jgi:hypothetical protein